MPADADQLERDLATAQTAGDWAGATTLALRGFGPAILGYLRGVLRDDDALGDVYSRFSEKLWLSLPAFEGGCSFSTWCHRLAWYSILEHRRGLARRRERRFADGEMSAIVQEAHASTAVYLKTSAKDALAVIRDQLDPEERSLLLLRVERKLPWKEIASVMAEEGRPTGEAALRKRFERLREKLHRLFREHGLRG